MFNKSVITINFVLRLSAIALLFIINPIAAIIINTFLDAIDGTIYEYFLHIKNEKYQLSDKFLDYVYYVGLMMAVIYLQFPYLWLLGFLFLYRSIGQLLFFSKKDREIFVYFPNFFEAFVLGLLIAKQLTTALSVDLTLPILFVFMLLKVWQEVFLHRQKKSIVKIFWLPLLRTLPFAFSNVATDED